MPTRPLPFEVERHDGGAAVAVSGEIDLATAHAPEETALRLLDEQPRSLVLGFSGVPFRDSTGIGVLVRLYSKASVTGCRLALRRPTPNVRAILDMTALTRIFRIEDDAP